MGTSLGFLKGWDSFRQMPELGSSFLASNVVDVNAEFALSFAGIGLKDLRGLHIKLGDLVLRLVIL